MKALSFVLSATLVISTVAAAADVQVLGVREGVAEQSSATDMQQRYKEFAEYVGTVTGRTTLLDASQDSRFMLKNMQSGKYAIMFVRPSGLAGRAIRENNYTLVAEAKDEMYAAIIVKKDSPLRSVQDLTGKRVAMADKSAFVTKVGLAYLRDAGVDPAKLQTQFTRYQDSAAFSVEQNVADAAIVAPPVAKAWEKKGGRILSRSKKVPSWAVLAAPSVPAAEVAKLRAALLSIESHAQGRKAIAAMGVSGFIQGTPESYVQMLTWIGV